MKTISIRELDYDEFLAEIRGIVRDEIESRNLGQEIQEDWMDMDEATAFLMKAKQTV